MFRSRRETLLWSHHKEWRRNMQRHWNDFDAAELLLQQKDIHLEHEDNCYFIQQLQQLKKKQSRNYWQCI